MVSPIRNTAFFYYRRLRDFVGIKLTQVFGTKKSAKHIKLIYEAEAVGRRGTWTYQFKCPAISTGYFQCTLLQIFCKIFSEQQKQEIIFHSDRLSLQHLSGSFKGKNSVLSTFFYSAQGKLYFFGLLLT
jgi:hypothetical protein